MHVLLLLVILGALLFYALCCLRPYKPIIEQLLVYNVEMNTRPVNVVMTEQNRSDRTLNTLERVPFVSFEEGTPQTTLYLTDAFTYEMHHKESKKMVYTAVDDEKTFLLVKKRDSHPYENLDQAIRRQKTFYCNDDVTKALLDFVCLSNEIDRNKLRIAGSADSADVIVSFESINNKINGSDNKLDNIDFVSYDGFDINNLKFYIPYCKIKNISLELYFDRYKDRYPIKTCICLDMLLYGDRSLESFPKTNLNVTSTNSFLSLFFEFFDVSQKDMAVKGKGTQILEQFDSPVSAEIPYVRSSAAVPGYRDGEIFYSELEAIDGVPLVKGMKVVLEKQPNDYENDIYVVEVPRLWRGRKRTSNALERCIDKPEVSKEDCQGVWDAPCEINEDCPYFQKNKRYPNYFGGCVDGYCQMPLGVKRKGYRLVTGGNPICRSNGKCDGSTEDDYAFPLDLFERRTAIQKQRFV